MANIVENMVKDSVKNAMNVDHTFEKMKMQHHQTTVTAIENKYAKIVKSFFESSNDTDSSTNWKSVVTIHSTLFELTRTPLTTDIYSGTNGTINFDIPSVITWNNI